MLISEPHNAYPNLPVQAFTRTTVAMADVEPYIKALNTTDAIKAAVYAILRNESGNGSHGVNDNYIGLQADGAIIGDGLASKVIATCVEPENGTGRLRRFCCFGSWKDSIDILLDQVVHKGLYIGGNVNNAYCKMGITNVNDFVLAYYKCWVTGNAQAVPPSQYYTLFNSLFASYNSLK